MQPEHRSHLGASLESRSRYRVSDDNQVDGRTAARLLPSVTSERWSMRRPGSVSRGGGQGPSDAGSNPLLSGSMNQ